MWRTSIFCVLLLALHITVHAHPLGIFSVNRYARIELPADSVRIFYVMDVAEIPAIQEISTIDKNHDGVLQEPEREQYSREKIAGLLQGLEATLDETLLTLNVEGSDLSLLEGQGGLQTVRLSFVLAGPAAGKSPQHTLRFRDANFASGRGWKEIVAVAGKGTSIVHSTVPSSDLTDELRVYPPELLDDPPRTSMAEVTYAPGVSAESAPTSGLHNAGVTMRPMDGFAELVSAKDLTLPVALLSLLVAMLLGAGHALTPGHGKTVVAAYLVGSRGTAKHAAVLGLTVTLTHTAGVFALGLIAMLASRYVLPETLYPWLSLASGLIVVLIGVSLLQKRVRVARGTVLPDDDHGHPHTHAHGEHPHGSGTHTHLPPGADGSRVSWRSLIALGVSGGLLPCPSALVVLLGAIAIGRIGFGLLLILAFSVGLAGVLTGIGLLLVWARGLFERFNTSGPFVRWLPVLSAAVVTVAGCVITIQALPGTGLGLALGAQAGSTTMTVLALGFTLGLKHALDADHLVAVSTIVGERKGILSSSIIGGLWGVGHTLSLMAVGLVVMAMHLRIPEKAALGLEFAVALMLVLLGFNVLRLLMKGGKIHHHLHQHGVMLHTHPHMHAHQAADGETHHHQVPAPRAPLFPGGLVSGARPLFIGMVHGLAGSAALMLVVLATIPTAGLALLYIAVFGVGSIGGMLVMSTLLAIPFVFTANKFTRLHTLIRALSGIVSVAFGLFLAWHIGFVQGLFL